MPTRKPGAGKTGRINPTNPRYQAGSCNVRLPDWAQKVVTRLSASVHQTRTEYVCRLLERAEKESNET